MSGTNLHNVGTLFVSSSGIVPVILVLVMVNNSKLVQEPISVGMVPLTLVNRMDNSFNSDNVPISVGIVPVMSVPCMVRYSNSSATKEAHKTRINL